MIIDSYSDAISVLVSLVTGFLICFIYDLFKSIRIIYRLKTLTIFIQDILFSVITSIITFLLLFVCVKGEIRLFILFFELTGFLAFRFLVSPINVKFLNKLNLIIKKRIFKPLNTLYLNLEKLLNTLCDKLFDKFFKKTLKPK